MPGARTGLATLSDAAQRCEGCGLYVYATQAVFGEGPRDAQVMLVGEQPGDREDVLGHPFVGPAGQLLDRALVEAGIDRATVYVTSIVKHSKWKHPASGERPTGKRRLHDKPNAYEVTACKPWLNAEIARVKPRVVLCLGSTAAQGLLGDSFRVTRQRGEFLPSVDGPTITATIHPSAVLRAYDAAAREREFAALVRDLKLVAERMNS